MNDSNDNKAKGESCSQVGGRTMMLSLPKEGKTLMQDQDQHLSKQQGK